MNCGSAVLYFSHWDKKELLFTTWMFVCEPVLLLVFSCLMHECVSVYCTLILKMVSTTCQLGQIPDINHTHKQNTFNKCSSIFKSLVEMNWCCISGRWSFLWSRKLFVLRQHFDIFSNIIWVPGGRKHYLNFLQNFLSWLCFYQYNTIDAASEHGMQQWHMKPAYLCSYEWQVPTRHILDSSLCYIFCFSNWIRVLLIFIALLQSDTHTYCSY